MRLLHEYWGWAAVVVDGLVGLWGIVLAQLPRDPGRLFWAGVAVATTITLGQLAVGVYLTAALELRGGDQHVFYAILIAFAFAFAYIYRAQLGRRPALYYGFFFLFVMGLGLRTITTFGVDF